MAYIRNQKRKQLPQQRRVFDAFSLHHILQNHGVVNAEQIFTARIGRIPQIREEGKTSQHAVDIERLVHTLDHPVISPEADKFREREREYLELNVTPAKIRGELT